MRRTVRVLVVGASPAAQFSNDPATTGLFLRL
jgi:hypothetical protein